MASFFVAPVFQPVDGNGNPYPGAKLYVYEAGTTSPLTVYSDNALTTAHTQPVVADANGVFPQIYMSADVYKFKLDTSADVTVATYDNVASMVAGDGGTLPVVSGGTGATSAPAARGNLGAAAQSDLTALAATVGVINAQFQSIGAVFGDLAAKDTVEVTDLTGMTVVVQTVFDSTAVTTVMDITDGTEYAAKAYTPIRDDSTIEVEVSGVVATGTDTAFAIVGVFRSGQTNALDNNTIKPNSSATFALRGSFSPGSTSALTISVRGFYLMKDIQMKITEFVATPV